MILNDGGFVNIKALKEKALFFNITENGSTDIDSEKSYFVNITTIEGMFYSITMTASEVSILKNKMRNEEDLQIHSE